MDFQGDLAASLVGHAEAVVEGREGGSGLGDESWTGAVAYEDAAIVTAMDAVAGLQHGASDGEDGVERHLLAGLALGAMGRWTVETGGEGRQEQHLAMILMTLVQIDLICACWESALGVLERVADGGAVDAKKAFADFTLREGALEMNFHFNLKLII